jgi:hypothetical protein
MINIKHDFLKMCKFYYKFYFILKNYQNFECYQTMLIILDFSFFA